MRLAALVGALFTTASVVGPSGPAQAYDGKVKLSYAVVGTSNSSCPLHAGGLSVSYDPGSASCFLWDSVDSTYFEKDQGGRAIKIEVRLKSTNALVGKVEFHPLDERLWVYDLRDDDDTFYAEVFTSADCLPPDSEGYSNRWLGTFRAPEEGHVNVNLGPGGDVPENCGITLIVTDNVYYYPGGLGYDEIGRVTGGVS